MQFQKIVIIVSSILLLAQCLLAFDGNRKGFILGLGAGFSSLSISEKYEHDYGTDVIKENYTPLFTNFKIGLGVNDQILIYWSSNVSWFSKYSLIPIIRTSEIGEIIGYVYRKEDKITFTSGTGILACSYYLKPDIPSFFLSGGIGYSSFDTPFESDKNPSLGYGLILSGGYEFSRHWNVEAGINYGNQSDPIENEIEIARKNTAFFITINALAY